jgi:hypothetical protein
MSAAISWGKFEIPNSKFEVLGARDAHSSSLSKYPGALSNEQTFSEILSENLRKICVNLRIKEDTIFSTGC